MSDDLGHSLQLQILSQLGELGQQIGVLQAQSTHIIAAQEKDGLSRTAIYGRLNELDKTVAAVKRIEPLVDAHEKAYQRGVGAAWLWRIVWGVLAGVAGSAITALASHFGWPPRA